MKYLILIPLLLIVSIVNAQDASPQWEVGLHAAPIFTTARVYNGFTGFTVNPGIYRSHKRIKYGFMPYYSRSSFSSPVSPFDATNRKAYTFDMYGGFFQFRYYFGQNNFRSYAIAEAGFGYNHEKLERPEEYGGSYDITYWNFATGIGAGVEYKLNSTWSLDANIRVDLSFSPDVPQTMTGTPSIGIFRKLGK